VPRCLDAVERAARETGHRALYLPNLIGTPDVVARRLRFAQARGAPAVVASPMLIGLPAFWEAVIFVSFGSRFAASRAACERLAAHLRAPWQGVMPALPVPGGGIEAENVEDVIACYGRDTMLLVGGSLQAGPGSVAERSRALVRAVERAAR
jgi:ribulose-bisphosphate carboxylase large chain